MRNVTVAATQMSCSWNLKDNLDKAKKNIKEAANQGADIILVQELFETPYFCQLEKYEYFKLASNVNECQGIKELSKLAKELNVVLPVSFFEKSGNTFFNSLVVIDADGTMMDTYRKTHIPDGHCYEEKFYFSPGDTGFRVWQTKYGVIGVAICWDQWFPETARSLALLGAEILMFPTAIGTEPILKKDSSKHWQNVMKGHAAANMMPLVASNRVGTEQDDESSMTFYGHSFISGADGEIVETMGSTEEGVIVHTFDLDELAINRYSWGTFRDRRPEKYNYLMELDAT